LVGGNSKAAAWRVARYENGFFPVGKLDELVASFKEMDAECARIGRNPSDLERMAAGGNPAGFSVDKLPELCKA
jgi:hypothetical protein